ncbi:hypothetical protein CCMA1212_004896 [Trichoderma ghanense]|uniref:PP4R3 EVH1-like domain-containing protein n=1 Tax=Trichoderma ghanense TaxID=65468 RepID=A0ABY2H5F9_9HYPO
MHDPCRYSRAQVPRVVATASQTIASRRHGSPKPTIGRGKKIPLGKALRPAGGKAQPVQAPITGVRQSPRRAAPGGGTAGTPLPKRDAGRCHQLEAAEGPDRRLLCWHKGLLPAAPRAHTRFSPDSLRLWSRGLASRDIPLPETLRLTLLCRHPRSRRTGSLVLFSRRLLLCGPTPPSRRPTCAPERKREKEEEAEAKRRDVQGHKRNKGPPALRLKKFTRPTVSKRHIAALRCRPHFPTTLNPPPKSLPGQVAHLPAPSSPHRIPFTQGTVAALTILDQPETPELSLQQHLDLAPDLVGYGNQLVATGDDPQSSMMAQPVPHQDKKRVKVYELRNNDWFDRGTGFCTAKFATSEDGHKDAKVIVESEDQPERLLLETTIQKQDGFQKQQGKSAPESSFLPPSLSTDAD